MTDENKTFEERLQEVQTIISRIEEGKLALEESVKQFEDGDTPEDDIKLAVDFLKEKIAKYNL